MSNRYRSVIQKASVYFATPCHPELKPGTVNQCYAMVAEGGIIDTLRSHQYSSYFR